MFVFCSVNEQEVRGDSGSKIYITMVCTRDNLCHISLILYSIYMWVGGFGYIFIIFFFILFFFFLTVLVEQQSVLWHWNKTIEDLCVCFHMYFCVKDGLVHVFVCSRVNESVFIFVCVIFAFVCLHKCVASACLLVCAYEMCSSVCMCINR